MSIETLEIEGTLAEEDWRRNLAVGDEVYWKDPDQGISSGIYRIAGINAESVTDEDTVLQLVSAEGSEAEVFARELLAESEAKLTVRLVIDVDVVLNGVSKEDFLSDLNRRAEIAIGNGMLTGDTEVEVAQYSLSADEAPMAVDPAINQLQVTVDVHGGVVETVEVTLGNKVLAHELVVRDADIAEDDDEDEPSKERNIFLEALDANFIATSIAPREDIRIRRDLIAQEILVTYPHDGVITREAYAADTQFGECLHWMHQAFDFQHAEGKTIAQFLRENGIPGDPVSLNVIQVSADRFNKDGIKATNITLKELIDARPLGEHGWLLLSGLEVWFDK